MHKSWKYWCKKYGFCLHSKKQDTRVKSSWYYLKGHGHVWRLNDKNMFECGDTYEDFDRWALCEIYSETVPKTEKEFKDFVKRALLNKIKK